MTYAIEDLTSSTYTNNSNHDYITQQLLDFVRDVPLESDAVHNIPRILDRYKSRIGAWELIKLLLNK